MSETDLRKEDWEACRSAAISSIRNCKAQMIVYAMQLKAADEELAKFPEEKTEEADAS